MECQHKEKYYKFIAIAQVISIVLVVFGHSWHEYPDGEFGHTLLVNRLMYTFRMPVFIFVAGFLMAHTIEKSCYAGSAFSTILSFVGTKVRRLLVPFCFLSLVAFVPRVLLSSYADDGMMLNIDSLWRGLVYNESMIVPYYWFIHTSFTLLVVCFVARIVMQKLRVSVLFADLLLVMSSILLSSDASLFSINMTLTYSTYFVSGIVYFDYMKQVDKYLLWTNPIFLLSLIVLWLLSFVLFENTVLMPACGAFGVLMIISLSRTIENRNVKIFDHLIGANYIIFLLSWFFNVASQQVLCRIVAAPWWFYSIISFISGIYAPWLFFRLLKKYSANPVSRSVAFLLGQKLEACRRQ